MNVVKPIALFLLVSLSGCWINSNKSHNKIIEMEQQQAMEFIKRNENVIREVGGIKDVSPHLFRMRHREALPFMYVFSVYGVKTSTSAVVNVSRSSGNAQFTLACLGDFPPPQDAFQDRYECKH